MKKVKRIIIFAIIILLIATIVSPFTGKVNAFSLQDMKDKADRFREMGQENAEGVLAEKDLMNEFVPIGRILITIANVVLVIVSIIMAIKYLTANPEQKGKLKQQLIGLVVSIIVIYGAVGIWTLIKNFMEQSGL